MGQIWTENITTKQDDDIQANNGVTEVGLDIKQYFAVTHIKYVL